MTENSSSKVASEDELGEKWDRCVADTILKTGTSLVHSLPHASKMPAGFQLEHTPHL